tara:strand:+ start:2732 stop:2992 length:261 start_codon:yes stop_codon:yes gene_type:complete
MQNSNNNILDNLVYFLRTNNIKPDDILYKFLNIQNQSPKEEEIATYDINDNSNRNIENDEDYKLLVDKLKNIKNIMNQLSLEISDK